jgi:hypothetical protein
VALEKNQDSLPLMVRPSGLLVKIEVDGGKPQKMRVDTGCASPLQWVASRPPSGPCSRQIAVGLTEVSMPLINTSVRIGVNYFQGVATGLQDHQIFDGEAGLLGTPLLCRFASVTFDAAAKRLFLKKY